MLERLDDETGSLVTFVASGARGTGQYRCAECGYGITIHAVLPDCPMCGGTSWEETAWSPISNAPAFGSPTASL